MTGFRWEIIEEYGPLFVDGALMTIKCTIICVILGTLWGLTLGLGRMAKAEHGPWKYILRYLVQFPVRFYVSAFRGTPLSRADYGGALLRWCRCLSIRATACW